MTTITTPVCSQCRHSDTKNKADLQVKGRVNSRPYKANLCVEHFDMLNDEEAVLTPIAVLSDNIKALEIWAEVLWQRYANHKDAWGVDNDQADRLHRVYIKTADRLQAVGLNY